MRPVNGDLCLNMSFRSTAARQLCAAGSTGRLGINPTTLHKKLEDYDLD